MTSQMPPDIAQSLMEIAAGTLTAHALSEICAARIRSHDHQISSFLYLADSVGYQKVGADGALGGIPLAIKDVFDVAGMPTTANSRVFAGRVADADAASVARLRNAGGAILGKLAAWECAMGGTSFTLPWPPARNPWDLDCDPGGSSTGSGAALAAGFCLGSLGSDTGGSIREPASWCGIAGLKPSYGLVSTDGVMAASFSLDHVGPMARTSRDCALLLDVLVSRPGAYSREIGRDLTGLRVGVVDLGGETKLELTPDVARAVDDAVVALTVQGAKAGPIRLPPLELFSAVCTLLSAVEGRMLHRLSLMATPELYDRLTLDRLRAGEPVAATDYLAANCVRGDLLEHVLSAHFDVLLMPTTRDTAPRLGAFDSHAGHPSLTRPWNVTGMPALSVRCGFASNGMPLAVQIIGRPGADALVLACGDAIEQSREDRSHWPDLDRLKPAQMRQPVEDSYVTQIDSVMTRAGETVRAALGARPQPASRFSFD